MKLLIFSPKGGLGKSSLCAALFQTMTPTPQIITNDKSNPYNIILKENDDYYLLPENKDIPIIDDNTINVIYDFGGYPDKRLKTFIEKSKNLIIIIPFNPDVVSFQVAISLYNEIKDISNNIIFCLNKAQKGDYELFKQQMDKLNIDKALFEIKQSKMFSNIFNKKQSINDIKKNTLLNHSYSEAMKQLNQLIRGIKNEQ